MSAHTPGPWTVSPSGTTVWHDRPHVDPNTGMHHGLGREIAKVTRADATDIANAALIAKAPTAPKLAEALRALVDGPGDGFGRPTREELSAARIALAEWDAQ